MANLNKIKIFVEIEYNTEDNETIKEITNIVKWNIEHNFGGKVNNVQIITE